MKSLLLCSQQSTAGTYLVPSQTSPHYEHQNLYLVQGVQIFQKSGICLKILGTRGVT